MKKLDQDCKTIVRVVGNTEEALDYLTWKFKKELDKDVKLRRLEIHHVTEIDVYGEFDDYVVIGEVKERGSISAYNELMRHLNKLRNIKPNINDKKINIDNLCTVSKLGFGKSMRERRYLFNLWF
jgi:hypothetical protein